MSDIIQKHTDEELIRRFCEGNNSAFDSLYNRYYTKLLYFIRQYSIFNEAEAKDILQEVFIIIMDKSIKFDRSRKFSIWIYTIASNKCKNTIKHNKLQIKVENEIQNNSPNNNDRSIKKAKIKIIREELKHINYKHKQVFLLRFNFGFTIKETASILDISEGTVKSRLFNCIQNLNKRPNIKSLK